MAANSLGREPKDSSEMDRNEPRSGGRFETQHCCRRFAAQRPRYDPFLGLMPETIC